MNYAKCVGFSMIRMFVKFVLCTVIVGKHDQTDDHDVLYLF